jgi:hypothetical protein
MNDAGHVNLPTQKPEQAEEGIPVPPNGIQDIFRIPGFTEAGDLL